jgi:hypothetical protein
MIIACIQMRSIREAWVACGEGLKTINHDKAETRHHMDGPGFAWMIRCVAEPQARMRIREPMRSISI